MSDLHVLERPQATDTDEIEVHHHTVGMTPDDYLRRVANGQPMTAACGTCRPQHPRLAELPCCPMCAELLESPCRLEEVRR